jgi:cobalamin synthase
VSLLFGGAGPWHDYIDYLRVSSAADLADRLNIGPASQLALLLDNHGLAHGLAVVFAVVAIAGTVVASRLVRDTLESLGWALVASLILLPVTWYHYPVALIPVAIAAWTRSRGMPQARRVSITIFVAWILADAAIALPVTTWIAMALVLVAVRMSRPSSSPTLGQVAPTVEGGPASGDAIDRVEVISR